MAAVGTNNESGKLYLDDMYESDKLFYSEHNSLVKEKNITFFLFLNFSKKHKNGGSPVFLLCIS